MSECRIEQIRMEAEELWILAIPSESVKDVIVDFAAFYLEKRNSVLFADRSSACEIQIKRGASSDCMLSLNDKTFSVTQTWLETVASMLTDVALYGWIDTAHVDQDFETGQGTIDVCVKVERMI